MSFANTHNCKESMKTIFKILVICVITILLSYAAMAEDTRGGWEPKSKNKNLFTVKADREFVGAKVEILDQNEELIAAQKLVKRKILIDFDDVRTGAYTIRITKGDRVKEYHFLKK